MGVDIKSDRPQIGGEYEKAYFIWINSRTPEELAELRRLGLDKPAKPSARCTVRASEENEFDPMDFHQSAKWSEENRSLPMQYSDERKRLWESVERLAAEFIDSINVRLTRDFLFHWSEIHLALGTTESSCAFHGLTREEFVRRAEEFAQRIDFELSNERQIILFRRIATHVALNSHPAMSFDVFAITAHLNVRFGWSLRRASRHYGLTVAALSKRSIAIRKALKLQNLWKSDAACVNYRLCNVRNYKRS